MPTVRLKCGIEMDDRAVALLDGATVDSLEWKERTLPPGPGDEITVETSVRPVAVSGVPLPPEPIALYIRVLSRPDGTFRFRLHSAAHSAKAGKYTFLPRELIQGRCESEAECREGVLRDLKRFLRGNL